MLGEPGPPLRPRAHVHLLALPRHAGSVQTWQVYVDLDRPPLRPLALQRALAPDGWRLAVLQETASTNAVAADRARAGEPSGLVVVAEAQTAGRGRLDRSWVSPPRAGLTFSVLLRPELPPAEWPWLPLLTGLAVSTALRERAEVQAVLKWPNDVLVADRKVCGILAEVPEPTAVVLGIGLNVTTTEDELPHAQATSLRLAGARTTDRDTILRAVLRALASVIGDAGAREAYRGQCSTLGRRVRVELPGERSAEGVAEAVDDAGRLVVDGVAYGAGDVVHLRPVS
jgi:BirA family biotin operon repressor/biotin-[acetyl-CoA-carboxylase] ligase